MNQINFNQTGGFPLDTNILEAMQYSYSLFNALGALAGSFAIIKGCQQTGNTISDGVVHIEGEIIEFKGGTISQDVVIREEIISLPFEDGQSRPVQKIRYAVFGNGAKKYPWADFVHIGNLIEFGKKNILLEKRLQKLEARLTKTIPIGLVAIWDRPADQIPEGWVEHTELQGRTPVGHLKNDTDFGRLGKTLGEKNHILTIQEMPRHSHGIKARITRDDSGEGGDGTEFSTSGGYIDNQINYTGGSQPHNNIQPSRIVRFIRFVGFND